MRFVINEQLTVIEPSEKLVEWLTKEWTLNNPEYEKKTQMGFWIGDTPEKLNLYSKVGDTYLLPQGLQQYIPLDLLLDSKTQYEYPRHIHSIRTVKDISLYDYQEDAVNTMLLRGRGILQSPPGSGKTQMGLAFIQRKGLRALWITHTIDLMKQSRKRAELYFDKSTFGEITGGECDVGSGITFATVQTLINVDLTRLKNYWNVIVVDECHRVSGSPTTMTRYYKVLNALNANHKIGLSATVHRSDGLIKATHALLGKVIYKVPDEAVRGKTMPVNISPVQTETGLNVEMLNTDGTLHYAKMLNYLSEDVERCKLIVKYILENRNESCLILSERISLLDNLIELLPDDVREQSVKITGSLTTKTGKAYRDKSIEEMRTGDKRIMFATYQLAKEGLDIPRLNRLFMVTPVKDYAVVAQSVGRIARVAEGKTDAICYDFVDKFAYAQRSFKKRVTTYNKLKCKRGDCN